MPLRAVSTLVFGRRTGLSRQAAVVSAGRSASPAKRNRSHIASLGALPVSSAMCWRSIPSVASKLERRNCGCDGDLGCTAAQASSASV